MNESEVMDRMTHVNRFLEPFARHARMVKDPHCVLNVLAEVDQCEHLAQEPDTACEIYVDWVNRLAFCGLCRDDNLAQFDPDLTMMVAECPECETVQPIELVIAHFALHVRLAWGCADCLSAL